MKGLLIIICAVTFFLVSCSQASDQQGKATAAQNRWHVISMKNDWKTIFPQ
jgi:hypothetical protein